MLDDGLTNTIRIIIIVSPLYFLFYNFIYNIINNNNRTTNEYLIIRTTISTTTATATTDNKIIIIIIINKILDNKKGGSSHLRATAPNHNQPFQNKGKYQYSLRHHHWFLLDDSDTRDDSQGYHPCCHR